ncbi:STN domain-containing protein [Fervidobacterium riparium]|uniref:Secretin/TonB short N-terminal domain-containing protein n=1 Tax=Fervidobacterium gondwanense DSM 13020 TaxID=1121883 RepID=A0A1M7SQ19_FERGO|nr:STN domain-containing protein [Fervidobacterium gondwanense]UXF00646.1 hypothetical protein IB67_03460 [Fervidobacterium riparium]SHN60637.1 hypothetical protein SAMN02745226_01131 [Fervidobacterium gondwanense DSM 13020]
MRRSLYSLLFFLISSFLFSVGISVTLDFTNTPLSEILDFISSETSSVIVYPLELSKLKITINLKNVNIETALKMLLLNLGFDFEKIDSETYVVFSQTRYYPRYITNYEPKYLDPFTIKSVLDTLDIENYVFENRNVFYSASNQKADELLSIISQLDVRKDSKDSSILLVKLLSISKSEFTISANKNANQSIDKSNIAYILPRIVERVSEYSREYCYISIPIYKAQVEESTLLLSETIAATMTIEGGFGQVTVRLINKDGTEFIKFGTKEAEGTLPLNSIPILKSAEEKIKFGEGQGTGYSILESGQYLIYLEFYKLEIENTDEVRNYTYVEKKDNYNLTKLKSDIELTYSSSSTILSIQNERNKASVVVSSQDFLPLYAEILTRIVDNTFIGIGFEVSSSKIYILVHDKITLPLFEIYPKIGYSINDNSFAITAEIDFVISFGDFSLVPLIKFGNQGNAFYETTGYGVTARYRGKDYEFRLGTLWSGQFFAVTGGISW